MATTAVLVAGDRPTDHATSTLLQLAAVALLLVVFGLRGAHRAIAAARPVAASDAGDGEPTPLWQLPTITAALTLGFGFGASWDAGLRAAGGCLLVGLAQAILIERTVAAAERRDGGRYVRLAGSSLLGTRLGRVA